MNTNSHDAPKANPSQRWLIVLLVFGCVLALVVGLLSRSRDKRETTAGTNSRAKTSSTRERIISRSRSRAMGEKEKVTAEEEVAARLTSFSKNRRALAQRYADKLGIKVPPAFEQFFDATETGNWEEVNRLFAILKEKGEGHQEALWPAIKETWGAHQSAHNWPAQELLDYGNHVLGSLKPGMVYAGGTDPGRFIPTMMNETSGSEPHIVLTQNALADGTYLDYVRFLYGDRFTALSAEDSQRSFNDYMSGIQKRFDHDKQFPDEPKQMRTGENFSSEEGRVQISGQVAVMAINENLLQTLMKKNPDLSFAMEESFSLPSTYIGATPLGPLLALGSPDVTAKLTAADGVESLNYWRAASQRLTSSPEFRDNENVNLAYAHMVVAQGNLFSSQNLNSEAEQLFRLAQQLSPSNVEPTAKLYHLLTQANRISEATTLLNQFVQTHPNKAKEVQKLIGK